MSNKNSFKSNENIIKKMAEIHVNNFSLVSLISDHVKTFQCILKLYDLKRICTGINQNVIEITQTNSKHI